MPNIDKILKQLKSRKVFRSVAIYAGFAFVLIQVCSIVFPALYLPEWTMTFLVVLVIIGFPTTLVLSWIYDITPAEEAETPPTDTSQPLGVYALTGLVLTVIGVGFWVAVGVFGVTFGGNEEVPSIGILMMDNLGGEDDEFWARGITEDLIIKVAGAGLIRVPTIDEIIQVDSLSDYILIGEQLRVKYLLTSSIHKKEDGFDLRCQLIEAESGNSKYANKWSEPIDNAPTIVGNLADNILKILQVSTKQDIMKAPTKNADAYEYYLKGKHKFEKRATLANTKIARDLLQKAIEIDDELISAKILLADTYIKYHDHNKAMEIYKKTLNQSEKLDEKRNIAIVIRKMGVIYFRRNHDYKKALDYFNRSLELSMLIDDKSLISLALNNIGATYGKQNNDDKEIEYYTRALQVAEEIGDKDNIAFVSNNIGNLYYHKGDIEKSEDYYTRSRKITEELRGKSFN